MRRIILFMMTSLDGFFEGPDHDLSWHNVDEEFNDFAIQQLDEVGTLLFGRVTYQMMASYWPTPLANEDDPIVAGKMNSLPKIVVSKTLDSAGWENTRLVKANVVEEIARLKQESAKDLAIFGSSDLAVSLLHAGLLDEARIMVNPVILGGGKCLFAGLDERVKLELIRTQTFGSGNVLLCYQPAK
jgi:dihydrofolate reductase